MVPHLPEIDRPAEKKIHEQSNELQRKFQSPKKHQSKEKLKNLIIAYIIDQIASKDD
jgi:hypothetical protein